MHLFRERHAAFGQCKSPRSLSKDAGSGSLFVRMLPEGESSAGVKFVLLLPVASPQLKPKPPLCPRPEIGPKRKAPDHLFTRSTQGCRRYVA